jgi:ketosteroid isomerase-like protein
MSAPWGLPFTGTTLALLPDGAAAVLADAACAADDVVFEVHAADFVDGALLPEGQPDRRVRLSDKLRRIERAARRVVGATR